jgi:pantothenate kinase
MSHDDPVLPPVADIYLRRVAALLADGQRKLLGLAGPPGAGKSTLAGTLQSAYASLAEVVPMDGFHLADRELKRLGLAARKGAPETFDSTGYAYLLQRIRRQRDGEIVYAPEFRRDIEEPVAGAIPVLATTRLIITEGNYLLMDDDRWGNVAGLLDEVWYVEADEQLCRERLVRRHEHFGRTHQAALAWVAETDEPNARLVRATKPRADVLFTWNDAARS